MGGNVYKFSIDSIFFLKSFEICPGSVVERESIGQGGEDMKVNLIKILFMSSLIAMSSLYGSDGEDALLFEAEAYVLRTNPKIKENSRESWIKVVEVYDKNFFDNAFQRGLKVDLGCLRHNKHVWASYTKEEQRKLLNMECELRICDIYAKKKGYLA